MKKLMVPLLVAFAFMVGMPMVGIGQSYFKGTTSWTSSSTNWSPSGVPTTSTDIVIDNSLATIPTAMTISAAMGAKSITFSNNFNLTNTIVLGDGGGTARILSLASGWNFTNNATSGSVTFQPIGSGGTANLSFSLAGSGTCTMASWNRRHKDNWKKRPA